MEGVTPANFDPFAGPAIGATARPTDPQHEIWSAVQMGPEASCAFNESVTLRLEGPLDGAALRSALNEVIARHEALRASFSPDGATLLIAEQLVLDLPAAALPSDEVAQHEALRATVAREVETPFDLARGPLVRARLLRSATQVHYLVVTAHHAVCDGWSMAVMLRDLAAFYSARAGGPPATLSPAPRFSEYAARMAAAPGTAAWVAAREFWVKKFSAGAPVLDLPTDRPRPALKTYASRREDYRLDAALVATVQKAGAAQGCSLFVTLLAALEATLHRLTGADDLVVCVPAAGQSEAGLQDLVGHAVNLLPLRQRLDGNKPFTQLLKEVRGALLDARENQDFTFLRLLRELPTARDASRPPLASVLFNLDQAIDGEKLRFHGLRATFHSNPRHFENFDLFINAAETRGQVVLECQFNTDLYDEATVHRWLSELEVLLRSLAEHPQLPLSRLAVLTAADRALIDQSNATAAARESGVCAHTLIERQIARTPDQPAVAAVGRTLSYAQLDARATSIARRLHGAGVRPGTLVGLCAARTTDLVAAVLGVWKAGAAYVPLDPSYPRDRLAFMLEDSKLSVLLTERDLRARLPDTSARVLCLDEPDAVATETSEALPPLQIGAELPAYVIYTSGSTGKPKGVLVPHRAVVNFLQSVATAPGLTARDVLLAVTTLSFDIAVLELWLPLSVGGRVVLANEDEVVDGALLRSAIEREGITAMQATPSTWRLLLRAGFEGGEQMKALIGGEALPRDVAETLTDRCREVWNMYGPTETTVWSTVHRLRAPLGANIPIGRPIDNTQTYVLDGALQLVPPGSTGELYIGGDGVTLGYLDRPALTAERFVPDPFRAGGKLYRTGDLARLRGDGLLEYLGRNDFQVKVRGHRIELGEIESALARHSAVQQAVVAAREDRPGDVRIVAYAVLKPSAALALEAARAHLAATLPDYMLPQHLVLLKSVPLTPNGKVDRKALPKPVLEPARDAQLVAPRTDDERILAGIWQRVLGVPRVSVEDDFFKLGGHSLLAAQAISQLNRDQGVALSMRNLFEAPTIEQLARHVERARNEKGADRIPRIGRGESAPLSLMQQRLWFLDQVNPGLTVYNLPSAFRIRGPLDAAVLERCLATLVKRHEPMRSTLRWQNGRAELQVAPELALPLTPPTDLGALPEPERADQLKQLLHQAANQPFDLAAGPLVRAQLFRLAPEEHVLFVMPHHAAWDGWSFDVFLRELDALYDAFVHGRPSPLADAPIRYSDFAAWQRGRLQGSELDAQRRYWKEKLSGTLPVLDLPTDRPRPAGLSYRGATEPFTLDAELIEKLTKVGRRQGATLYMVLLAAFKALLFRWTGQGDVLVGTPIRGRSQPETEDLIGFFVNTLVLRTQFEGATSFAELLRRTRAVCLEAFSHQDMPFELLLQQVDAVRDASRTPIYQAFFTFQDVSNRRDFFGPLPYSQIHVHCESAPTELSLWVKQNQERGLVGGLDYFTDLFDRDTMARFLGEYRELLEAAVRDAEVSVARISILPAAERERLAEVNRTRAEYPREQPLHRLVEAQMAREPDRPAVALESGGFTTHAELHAHANRIARRLRAMGVQRGALVGVCTERSVQMVAALLGILKAGAAYVPLDPAYPVQRLGYMIEDSHMKVLLTEQRLLARVAPAAELPTLCLDRDAKVIAAESGAPLQPSAGDAQPEDPAYVIYTSGSTGKPKGVAVPHRAVANFLCSVQREPGLTAHDVLVAVTTLSFDIAGLELWLPLLTGAKLVLTSRDTAADGKLLLALVNRVGATTLQATPTTWRLLLQAGFEGGPSFRALCGGEAVPRDLTDALARKVSAAWNMYGPTETTIWSTCHRMQAGGTPLIGRPLANTSVHVLDGHLQAVPLGVPGELYIGGDGVALGYLNQPALTAERFVGDPFAQVDGPRLYRTGDTVRMRASGDLEFLGRNDGQVKLRGFRIETGEIEAALLERGSIAQAVAGVRELAPGDTRLIAWWVARPGESETDTDLRRHLRALLPDHMVPQLFQELDAFPLTPNGKVDRKALPTPRRAVVPENAAYVQPRSPVEQLVADVWSRSLRVPKVSIHDNFFALGGHSLLCLEVIAEIEKSLGQRLSPRVLLLNSLEQVAAQLEQHKTRAQT